MRPAIEDYGCPVCVQLCLNASCSLPTHGEVVSLTGGVHVTQVAQSFGLLLGTILMNPKTAQTIAAILMLAFVLTGGYFVRGNYLHNLLIMCLLLVNHSLLVLPAVILG